MVIGTVMKEPKLDVIKVKRPEKTCPCLCMDSTMALRKKKFRRKKAQISDHISNASCKPDQNKNSLKITRTKKPSSPTSIYDKYIANFTKTKIHKTQNYMEPYEGRYKSTGLSPKDKMFIISRCQTSMTRYVALKNKATEAIKHNKIFSVCGSCNSLRKALVERGWIEKLSVNRMNIRHISNGNMSKSDTREELERLFLSHLVEKYDPSFIWRTKEHYQTRNFIDAASLNNTPMTNKLQVNAAWTSKQGLCATMKRSYWFYIEGVAEVYSPRTYNSYDNIDVDSFNNDFKITACTSLLKWVLSMVANNRPVFRSTGVVPISVIVFALKRCKEYLYRKQNRDIDEILTNVSVGQWNSFLENYYSIISKSEYFELDKEEMLNVYMSYAKLLLKEMHKYRPQLSCEGCHNIWIIKPAHCCRGKGIRMGSKLGVLNDILFQSKSQYVVQKYIEEPLLIYDTKFDIRQYYLISNTCPLVIWMYKNCYLKFSSQKYNLKNYHESIHLTNNAVQRKYKNCENRHGELPLSNMWDLETYISYLEKIGKHKMWHNKIYPGMRKSIVSIMLGCQDSLVACKNRFELYGCDFLLDKDYRPWLIEINSCPDMSHSTPVTAQICPAVITDIVKVIIDYANDPTSDTGNFECIYRQPHSVPRHSPVGEDLTIRGYSLPLSYFDKEDLKHEPKDQFNTLVDDCNLDIAASIRMVNGTYHEHENTQFRNSDHPSSETISKCSRADQSLSVKDVANKFTDIIEKVVPSILLKEEKTDSLDIENIIVVNENTNSHKIVTHCNVKKTVDNNGTNKFTPYTHIESEKRKKRNRHAKIVKIRANVEPLEEPVRKPTYSTEKLNVGDKNEVKQISIPVTSSSENEDLSQVVNNLLSFLNRRERERIQA